MAKALNCCQALLKNGMCLGNTIIVLLGLGLIAIQVYVVVVTGDLSPFAENGYLSVPILLLILGCAVTVVFFIGCCGTMYKSYCLMITFATILGVILIMEFIAGVSVYFLRNQAETAFNKTLETSFMTYGGNDTETTALWDRIQQDSHCCGLNKSSDYVTLLKKEIPQSCCIDQNQCNTTIESQIFQAPCSKTIEEILQSNLDMVAKYAIIMAGIHLIWLLGACTLAVIFKNRSSYEHV